MVRLADKLISERSAAQHADFALAGVVPRRERSKICDRSSPQSFLGTARAIRPRPSIRAARAQTGTRRRRAQTPRSAVSDARIVGSGDRAHKRGPPGSPLGRKITHPFKSRTNRFAPLKPSSSKTHSCGTSNCCSPANATSAAVWLAMVFSSLCLSDDNERRCAAFIASSCHLYATDHPDPIGNQNVVSPFELGSAQPIECELKMDATPYRRCSAMSALCRQESRYRLPDLIARRDAALGRVSRRLPAKLSGISA